MRNFCFILLIAPIVWSCGTNTETEPEKPVQPDTLAVLNPDTLVEISDPFTDSLKAYFDFPLDFYELKRNTLHMLSGYSRALNEDYAHKIDDPDADFYCYWAHEFDMRQQPIGRSLVFATWKPWKTKQQRSYENDNETLIGFESRIEWDGLKSSNFVGMKIDSAQTRFGEPMSVRNDCLVYYLEDKILILHESNSKIDWFRYYWMDQKIENTDSLSEALFVW